MAGQIKRWIGSASAGRCDAGTCASLRREEAVRIEASRIVVQLPDTPVERDGSMQPRGRR
jgi:hypothetical protein